MSQHKELVQHVESKPLEVNEYHFSEDEARKKAKVAPPDPPTSRAELTEKNKLWKREKASLVEKLETSVIEARIYKEDLENLKGKCQRMENDLFGTIANGSIQTKDQLKKKFYEVEELYDQQAKDRKKMNALEFQCKEAERMIKNLRENVDTLMQEAEDTKTRRREEYKALKIENLKLKHSLEELERATSQKTEELENFSLNLKENGSRVHETEVKQNCVDNVIENAQLQLATDTQPFSIKTE
ncbi:coiled-coil domain-containing protein 136-like [Halichondria panicea]|uniref:coiled-coil domain-containing protein 136-like n=1 Tax=Halichondria panicea TaxID=6063 RepID=UPI00312B395D